VGAGHLESALGDRGEHLGGVHVGRDEPALDLGDAPALHVVERGDEAVGFRVLPQAPHLETEVVVHAGSGGGGNEDRKQGGQERSSFMGRIAGNGECDTGHRHVPTPNRSGGWCLERGLLLFHWQDRPRIGLSLWRLMPDPQNTSGAVFLSYAHEDAEAARRIADALRAFGCRGVVRHE